MTSFTRDRVAHALVDMFLDLESLTLALTTLRPTNRTSFDRRNPLMLVLLPIRLVDLCRLENSHGTAAAALFAPFAPPPVLADASAAALLAPAALPPVLTNTAAARCCRRIPCT